MLKWFQRESSQHIMSPLWRLLYTISSTHSKLYCHGLNAFQNGVILVHHHHVTLPLNTSNNHLSIEALLLNYIMSKFLWWIFDFNSLDFPKTVFGSRINHIWLRKRSRWFWSYIDWNGTKWDANGSIDWKIYIFHHFSIQNIFVKNILLRK